MLAGSVRGNWRDLLLMPRAPFAGTPNDDTAATGERTADRYIASAMVDAPEGLPLRYHGPLPGGIGR
jgi:hypothetical protein